MIITVVMLLQQFGSDRDDGGTASSTDDENGSFSRPEKRYGTPAQSIFLRNRPKDLIFCCISNRAAYYIITLTLSNCLSRYIFFAIFILMLGQEEKRESHLFLTKVPLYTVGALVMRWRKNYGGVLFSSGAATASSLQKTYSLF